MPRIFLFLSTGRCGTQWLASNLGEAYRDLADVTHEPLGPDYRPREFLRSYDRLEDMLQIEAIREHLDHIDRVIADRIYVETGWPSYAAVPLFVERFGDEVAIVRIARHPVPTAISLTTLGFWAGRADRYATHAILDPWCEGTVQQTYTSRWREMSPYEKCLYWWTELHLYADELRTRLPATPFFDVRFEALFDAEGPRPLRDLVSFLGLPERASLHHSVGRPADAWRQRTPLRFDWREIFDHPNTLAVAEQLGYKVRWHDAKSLRLRYRAPVDRRVKQLVRPARRALSRLRATLR